MIVDDGHSQNANTLCNILQKHIFYKVQKKTSTSQLMMHIKAAVPKNGIGTDFLWQLYLKTINTFLFS